MDTINKDPSVMDSGIDSQTRAIIGCAMKVHSTLGFGFLESVYENALAHELRKAGFKVEQQVPIKVKYDGLIAGDFFADIVVDSSIILELKAVESISRMHEVQLVNYLNASGRDNGLLFNFGACSLQFKRKFRLPKKTPPPASTPSFSPNQNLVNPV